VDGVWRSLIRCDDTARKIKAGQGSLLEIITVNDLDLCIRLVRRVINLTAHLRHNLFEDPLATLSHTKLKAYVGQ
jgi:hypothetical protein